MSSEFSQCNVQTFAAALRALTSAPRLLVAYSGGLDSHTLLHLLAALREDQPLVVRAVHVNHGLQPEAEAWSTHCQTVCEALAVPLQVVCADARPAPGESPEAAARRVRYAACARLLQAGEELITAHTADDQAETLLLRLLRGSGTAGSVGIHARRALGEHQVIRPLLGFTRAALRAYAERARLQWIEDPSNRELRYDRNFVREQVLPVLQQRWPAAAVTLARAAANFADGAAVLASLAQQDLAAVRGDAADCLSVSALLRLALPRRSLVLRQWLQETADVTPSHAQLGQLMATLVARADSQPCVRCSGAEVRRYRDQLMLVREVTATPPTPLPWSMDEPLLLPDRATPLRREEFTRMGLVVPPLATVEVRYRRGGERIRLCGHAHHKSLKKLFQERGVPPWQREHVPLLYIDGELAAVTGIGVAAAFCDAAIMCENTRENPG